MQASFASGREGKPLLLNDEAIGLHFDYVASQGKVVESELAGAVAAQGLRPGRILRLRGDLGALDGAVLRIVDKPRDRDDNCCAQTVSKQQESTQPRTCEWLGV